jgi:hypothetical protein
MLGMDSNIIEQTKKFLHDHSVQTHASPCLEQTKLVAGQSVKDKPFAGYGSLNQMRWRHYRDWTKKGKFTHVWTVDVRDSYFQANPFLGSLPSLGFFTMAANMSSETGDVVETCFSRDMRNKVINNGAQEICLGTVVGNADAFIDFCERMMKVQKEMAGRKKIMCHNHDQPPGLTVLFGQGARLGDHFQAYEGGAVTFFPDHGGACAGDDAKQHLNEKGQIINTNGAVIPVLHRWDDCATARSLVLRSVGTINFNAPKTAYGNIWQLYKQSDDMNQAHGS